MSAPGLTWLSANPLSSCFSGIFCCKAMRDVGRPPFSTFQGDRSIGIDKLPIPRRWPALGRVSVAAVDVVTARFDVGW